MMAPAEKLVSGAITGEQPWCQYSHIHGPSSPAKPLSILYGFKSQNIATGREGGVWCNYRRAPNI